MIYLYWFSRMLFITSSTIASEASVVDIFVIQSPLNAGASFGIDDTISVVLLGVALCAGWGSGAGVVSVAVCAGCAVVVVLFTALCAGWDAACAGCAAVLAAG